MSRRVHTTDLGCIACDALTDIGAGKEGWLVDNPDLLISLDTHSMALANRSLILILHWSSSKNGGPDPDNNQVVKIRPDLSPIESECISAVEWLVFDDDVSRVLAVGTSCGYLLIYSLHGVLIHKQIVNTGKILKLRVRGTKRDLTEDRSSEEVCVVMTGVIARFEGSDIQVDDDSTPLITYLSFTGLAIKDRINMLRRWFQGTDSLSWNTSFDKLDSVDSGLSFMGLPYQLWNVSKYGPCSDAAITGVMPPPLLEIESSQHYYCAVTIGDDAVISAFRLSEDKSRSLVGAILSKVVPAAFSTIASFSKLIWRSEQKSTKKPEVKTQPFARDAEMLMLQPEKFYLGAASPLTCLKDRPRKGEKLTLSPNGTLAAITDSLGRILLLDTQALVVVRLWKGYRDANCLFVEMLVNKDTAASASAPAYHGYSKSDYCLCLAIHAPRKGIVEVWQMRTGPRLVTIPCPRGSKILQPTYRFNSALTSSSPHIPLEVFFLNGDSGQISVLNQTLN